MTSNPVLLHKTVTAGNCSCHSLNSKHPVKIILNGEHLSPDALVNNFTCIHLSVPGVVYSLNANIPVLKLCNICYWHCGLEEPRRRHGDGVQTGLTEKILSVLITFFIVMMRSILAYSLRGWGRHGKKKCCGVRQLLTFYLAKKQRPDRGWPGPKPQGPFPAPNFLQLTATA